MVFDLVKKSDSKLTIPVTVEANQALLDNYNAINRDFATSGETSSDDVYLTDQDYNSLMYEELKRLYTWQPDNVSKPVSGGNDWLYCYTGIYYANSVIYNLDNNNLHGTDADNVRGQAYALRAARYLDGAQIWCPAYDKVTAATDLGMPLRLDPDMNYPSERSSVAETYRQIIDDLRKAIGLLPDKPAILTRMSKPAALGLFLRRRGGHPGRRRSPRRPQRRCVRPHPVPGRPPRHLPARERRGRGPSPTGRWRLRPGRPPR